MKKEVLLNSGKEIYGNFKMAQAKAKNTVWSSRDA